MSMLHITIYERRVGGEAGLIIGAVTGTSSVLCLPYDSGTHTVHDVHEAAGRVEWSSPSLIFTKYLPNVTSAAVVP
jgi:hypothetical protein